MIVRIKATLSASQLSSLAFSPSDFAHILQNDFSIKMVAAIGFEPIRLIYLATHFKCVVSRQFHHAAIKIGTREGTRTPDRCDVNALH